MTENTENKITVDGVDYNVADLSEVAKQQIQNLQFVEAQLQQLNNEWAVADTARMGYSRSLAREAAKKDQD